jgi:dipeptidyl aminopeptidase/acylaminoacyl peptidase
VPRNEKKSKRNGAIIMQIFVVLLTMRPCVGRAWQTVRPITVDDVIGMTRLANGIEDTRKENDSAAAKFSPNGKRFVIVLRKGDVVANVNEFSMYLFETATAGLRPKQLLVTMRSSSNREAIKDLRWMNDNRTLMFLGENPGENSQVYSVDVQSHRVSRLTSEHDPIVNYQVSGDYRRIVYLAERQSSSEPRNKQSDTQELVVGGETLLDLLAGRTGAASSHLSLFSKDRNSPAVEIGNGFRAFNEFLSLSPNGRYVILDTMLQASELRPEWRRYDFGLYDSYAKSFFDMPDRSVGAPFEQYLLMDLLTRSIVPLWRGPRIHDGFLHLRWSDDGNSVFLKDVYLPLDEGSRDDLSTLLKEKVDVRVDLPSLAYTVQSHIDWGKRTAPNAPLRVSLREDLNSPPKIYVSALTGESDRLLLDLNPQFEGMAFGKVEIISWKVYGIPVKAGLYLPPDFRPGTVYPLVIQTHGFQADRFSMDGREEWSSGFAARLLAARGIAVLQTYEFADPADHDRVGGDRGLGNTMLESFRTFAKLVYETAVSELDRRGFIDPGRVGISGFSRTVWFVDYTLTHSDLHIAAALLTDGIDAGYFNYLAFGIQEFAEDNGGKTPFGPDGLALWMREAPGFNLDKVNTPVRLVCLNTKSSLLESWEWYEGLKLLGKPVDMIAIPNGSHLLQRPLDRKIAMEGMADWFDFWLQGHERHDDRLAAQYARWRLMRSERHTENGMKKGDGGVSPDSVTP